MCPQSQQTSSTKKDKKGMLVKHGISGSNRFVIKRLEEQLRSKQQRCEEAERVNRELRAKEQVLLENIAAQGETLHFVALAALQQPDLSQENGDDYECTMASMARCLMEDVKVHAMLEEVGRAARAADEESYTTRCMRAAFTPQRVAEVRNYSLAQVVQHLQRLTMKLALLLQTDDDASGSNRSGSAANNSVDGSSMHDDEEGAPPRLSYSIDGVVDEYTELAMLLHVASDKVNLQLGTINLDTMSPQEPPAGHWKRVVGHLKLRPDQINHVCTGFQVYASKSAPLVAAMHELVRIMRTITGSMPPPRSVQPGSKPESACAGAAAAAAAAGAHDSPCCSRSVQYPAPSSGCEAHSNEESGSFVSHGSCSDGQPGGSSMHAQQQQQPHCDGSDQQPALTLEDADRLESLLRELLHNIMRMREVHRGFTFLWLNTLDKRQKAVSIVKSFPFWSQPLTMCKVLLEQQQAQQQQRQPSTSQQQSQQPMQQHSGPAGTQSVPIQQMIGLGLR